MRNQGVDLKKLLAGAQLPALPQSAIRLLELSQDPDNGPPEFAVPIESDPGLTGQVLRFVNSSYFGFVQEISSVRHAITMVGIRTIKNFALWSAVFSLMPNPKCGPFDLKSLWQDSLRRALFSRAHGKRMGLQDAEDLFATALLQDMAVPLLAKEMPAQYQDLLNRRDGGAVRLSDLESERFGWTHADAGALMARQWKLPERFVELVERHTELPDASDKQGIRTGRLAVAISALMPSTNDPAWCERQMFLSACQPLGFSLDDLRTLFQEVDKDFAEFAPFMKLAIPERDLVEMLDTSPTEASPI